MKKYLNKRNIYILLFTLLYILCSICSLIHSFAFFGLANNLPMSIMLGTCFEIGQFAVLMSLLTTKKNEGKIMQYILLIILTVVQILGNVFSSFKYLMINSVSDLEYFKRPIFIFTDLPDDITTVIVTWIIGAILPCVCLLLTSMVSNYIMDTDPDDNKQLSIEDEPTEGEDEPEDSEETEQEPQEQENNIVRNEEQEEVDRRVEEESKEDDEEAVDDTDAEEDKPDESRADEAEPQNLDELKHIEEKEEKTKPHFVNLK